MAKPDWEAIKAAYQAGESVRGIANRFGISHTAINNRAKKEGWSLPAKLTGSRSWLSACLCRWWSRRRLSSASMLKVRLPWGSNVMATRC